MSKLIKWLQRNKKRHYKVVYIATGFMGNEYDAGIFEFNVSDQEIKNGGFGDYRQYGFHKNFRLLEKHFTLAGGVYSYLAADVFD